MIFSSKRQNSQIAHYQSVAHKPTTKIEGKTEVAKKALNKGLSIEDIIDLTGLSQEQIEGLL